jgi:glutathione gamma-glutamylcysteinyltransferase
MAVVERGDAVNLQCAQVGRGALADVESEGVSFDEFLLLAECNGASCQPFGASDSTLAKFRAAVYAASCRSGSDLMVVASFSRRALAQTGCGHYSPICAYHVGLFA